MTPHLFALGGSGGEVPAEQSPERARVHARELARRLADRGLCVSGSPHVGSAAGAIAVAALRNVHPYVGRLAVLLPGPGTADGLLWHWPRPYRGYEHTGACWYQPFSPAGAYADTANRFTAAIEADVRRRGRRAGGGSPLAALARSDGEAGVRRVLDSIGRPLHKLVYRQLKVLDAVQREVEDPALLRRLYEIDHLGMRTLRGLERIAVLGGARARQLPDQLLLTTVLRQAASQVEQFSRVRIPPPGIEVDLPRDVAPDIALLLAELVENATRFSPRDTDVLLTAARSNAPSDARGAAGSSAGLRIEIADRGLPMPPDQRAGLNRLLTAPDSAGLPEQINTGPIGLLVVARLAERHGVRVVLHPRTGGGTRAVVELPQALLLKPRVIAGVLEPTVEAVEPVTGPVLPAPTVPAPSQPIEQPIETAVPIESADAPLPRRRTGPASTTGPAPVPETEPADGNLPALPRRAGAHRAAGTPSGTNGPADGPADGPAGSTTTGAGAGVGAAAAFLQGAHSPADDRALDQPADRAADQARGDPPLETPTN